MPPGILTEHGFKHKGNHYATLPWFGMKITQKHAKRIKTNTWSTQVFVATWNDTFSTSGQRQVTTCCTCAVTSRKKCHVSGCRRQAGDVCCLRCLLTIVTARHVSTWAGNVDFGPSFNVLSISEVALDSFAVEFWGWVVLYSIVLSSVILFS